MPTSLAPARSPVVLTPAQFGTLADVPPEIEWFANLTNPNTRRAYRQDIADFMAFAGLRRPEEFRAVTRAHVIAWREQLVSKGLANDTIRRKLAALRSKSATSSSEKASCISALRARATRSAISRCTSWRSGSLPRISRL
jgi:hypothetical protein